jgi:DUF4097 and DUF4098 domain-containing protein YvlB
MNKTQLVSAVSGLSALIALFISGCVIISSSGCIIVDDDGDKAKFERTVDLSRPAASETLVEVVNDDGAVVIQGQEAATFTLAAKITAHATTAERAQQYAEQTRVDLASESGLLKVIIDRPKNLHNEWVNVDVRLSVPRKIDVNLRSSDGRVETQDLIGTLKARTSDGSIHVRQAQGLIELETSDGQIECIQVQGPRLYAKTSDGSIRLEGCSSEECEVHTSDGQIKADGILSAKLSGHTSDGSIHIRYDSQAQPVVFVDLTTNDGQIELTCPPQVSATVDASVGDGHISTDIPITIEGKIGKSLKGQIGKAEGRITLRTGDGSIRIR